jgi:hypothetical protein
VAETVGGERLALEAGTLALLADLMFGAPLVPKVLDAYLKDRGADPDRRWRLVLTGAEVVADEDAPAAPPGGGAG